jgi:hypothetical protein
MVLLTLLLSLLVSMPTYLAAAHRILGVGCCSCCDQHCCHLPVALLSTDVQRLHTILQKQRHIIRSICEVRALLRIYRASRWRALSACQTPILSVLVTSSYLCCCVDVCSCLHQHLC